MFNVPPPANRTHWVYEDPSGVPEPTPFARRWQPRAAVRAPRVVVRKRRLIHREA